MADKLTKLCFYCGSRNMKNAQNCRDCGKKVPQEIFDEEVVYREGIYKEEKDGFPMEPKTEKRDG